MEETDYVKSYHYEGFIRNLRNCETDQFGAYYQYMQNLIRSEKGSTTVNHLKPTKLLADVKKYMLAAVRFALKQKREKNIKDTLNGYLVAIEAATSSEELLVVCSAGRDLLSK